MVFVLVAVGFLGCLLVMGKVSNPLDGDVKKTRISKNKKRKQCLKFLFDFCRISEAFWEKWTTPARLLPNCLSLTHITTTLEMCKGVPWWTFSNWRSDWKNTASVVVAVWLFTVRTQAFAMLLSNQASVLFDHLKRKVLTPVLESNTQRQGQTHSEQLQLHSLQWTHNCSHIWWAWQQQYREVERWLLLP